MARLILWSDLSVAMVGPVGFEPTTSAESIVYGYPHALRNFFIPRFRSVIVLLDSGARRHPSLGPNSQKGLARLRPRCGNEGSLQRPTKRRVSEIIGIKLSRGTRARSPSLLPSEQCTSSFQVRTTGSSPGNDAKNHETWTSHVTR